MRVAGDQFSLHPAARARTHTHTHTHTQANICHMHGNARMCVGADAGKATTPHIPGAPKKRVPLFATAVGEASVVVEARPLGLRSHRVRRVVAAQPAVHPGARGTKVSGMALWRARGAQQHTHRAEHWERSLPGILNGGERRRSTQQTRPAYPRRPPAGPSAHAHGTRVTAAYSGRPCFAGARALNASARTCTRGRGTHARTRTLRKCLRQTLSALGPRGEPPRCAAGA